MKSLTPILVTAALLASGVAWSGTLNAPASWDSPDSAMFTFDDLFHRLHSGRAGSKRSGTFAEPTALPSATAHTIDDIMAQAPVVDNERGALAAEVTCGKTFWGLHANGWGLQAGTLNCPIDAPSNVRGALGNQFVTLAWDAVTDAASYTVYGASQSGVTAANYLTLEGGVRHQNVTSPYRVSGLTNDVTYHFILVAVDTAGVEGFVSSEVSSTPSNTRFVDNLDGTVTDVSTGLVMLQNVACFEATTWALAETSLAALQSGQCGLTDGSVAGTSPSWRFPTLTEADSLLNVGTSTVFTGVQNAYYWLVENANNTSFAWAVNLGSGFTNSLDKTSTMLVWPVRSAQ